MIRGIGLRGAVAVNVITMIGIGPLITIPLVLNYLHGSLALSAWIVGALIALCDGLVWAELGSMYPGSGGTYVFLREAFGRERFGRMLAFLFAWQIVLAAPLLLGTGYIGFAQYATYLWAPLGADPRLQGIVAAAVGVVTLALLYRPIGRIAQTGIALSAIAIATILAVIAAAAVRFAPSQAFAADPHTATAGMLAAGLGPALVITLYDYYGYGQSCTVSDEVRDPARVLPISIVVSILLVGVLYVLLQIGVLGSIPWQSLVGATSGAAPPDAAKYVASTVVERGWGHGPAIFVTVAILLTAFASTFGNLLGYSRIPFAAARDGVFLKPFGQLHSSDRFPHVALLTIGLLALPVCFFDLGTVINWLTTGLVVIQSLAQIAALIALRRRGEQAPYRMWLFPIPAILAAAGWVYIFCSAGLQAILFGIVSLALGVIVYLWRAKVDLKWPFVPTALALLLGAMLAASIPAKAASPPPQFNHSRIVERDGFPVFEVDGKPFFVYGAAFFYERLPMRYWEPSMVSLKSLGINTLDLYVIWNWHELADGQFDFDGHTSPRRDLHTLLNLARKHGFKLIVRPGPVIRNEWRNGGYPPWLLERPEYGMPLHDLLEGRYPPTATLQNARSDDAAAEWMANATHMRYSERWLKRAMREFEPYADLVLAVQLDDDQGAYIDNQTWPAPHLTAYLNHLRSVIHGVTGSKMPVFINTYQMKVTASSPVWAMGNWYQSDAFSIGEHDRAQLEFSTGLLQTRPHQPLMLSEFQAGWLLGPDDIRPRPADPSNTILAMTTAMGMGVRGIVNFPAQDTLYPSGMEAPFANAFYAWDAALPFQCCDMILRAPRSDPTERIGSLVRDFGSDLASSRPLFDAGIVYVTSVLEGKSAVGSASDRTLETQRACRSLSLACKLVDLRYIGDGDLRRLPILFVPNGGDRLSQTADSKLARYTATGGVVVRLPAPLGLPEAERALARARRKRVVDSFPGATFAASSSASLAGFLFVPNYGDKPAVVRGLVIRPRSGVSIAVSTLNVPAHDAVITPIRLKLRSISAHVSADAELLDSDCRFAVVASAFRTAARPAPILSVTRRGLPCHVTVRTQRTTSSIEFSDPVDDTLAVDARWAFVRVGNPYCCGDFVTTAEGNTVPIRRDVTLVPERWTDAATCDGDSTIRMQQGLQLYSICDPTRPGYSAVSNADVFQDGSSATTLQNALVRVIFLPAAGARALVFDDRFTKTSVFTTVGALRDDVKIEPPLSTTDRIAKYTHQFPAGMFNRPYRVRIIESGKRAVVRFSYDAPDVVPAGAHFERTVTLEPDVRYFSVDERAVFDGDTVAVPQQAVSVTSLAVGDSTNMTTQRVLVPDPEPFTPDKTIRITNGNAIGFYDTKTHELATIAWRTGDVTDATLLEKHYSVVARLTLSPGRVARTLYGYFFAGSIEAARSQLAAAAAAAQGPVAASANNAR